MAITPVGGACPNCGGKLEHKGKGMLVCPFCDGVFFDSGITAAPIAPKRRTGPKTPDEIDAIVQRAIKAYEDPEGYGVHIGLLDDKLKKEDRVRRLFEINDAEVLYMYYDETMLCTCKEGYALTNAGMHIRYSDFGTLYYPWDKFTSIELRYKEEDDDFYLDGHKLTLTGNSGALDTYKMLYAIQDEILY